MGYGFSWQAPLASFSPLYIFILWPQIQSSCINSTRYDGNIQFGWFKCVVSNMSITNNFVSTCNANGYEKYGNCLAPWYFALGVEMVKYGSTTCVIFLMWIVKLTFFGYCHYWLMMFVVWIIFKGSHYIDLWLVFQRMAYGMSYATIERNINEKMILPSMHKIKW
jgi:hypothetical protein